MRMARGGGNTSKRVCLLDVGQADLGTKYAHLRRLRRDGNCFYRAMAFKVFEWLCTDASEADVTRIATIIHDSKDQLIALGWVSCECASVCHCT